MTEVDLLQLSNCVAAKVWLLTYVPTCNYIAHHFKEETDLTCPLWLSDEMRQRVTVCRQKITLVVAQIQNTRALSGLHNETHCQVVNATFCGQHLFKILN